MLFQCDLNRILQVEEALRLKEKGLASEVIAVTMGPVGNKVILYYDL